MVQGSVIQRCAHLSSDNGRIFENGSYDVISSFFICTLCPVQRTFWHSSARAREGCVVDLLMLDEESSWSKRVTSADVLAICRKWKNTTIDQGEYRPLAWWSHRRGAV